jgi:invasion protein IalB
VRQSLLRAAAALCVAGLGLAVPAAAQQTQPPQQAQPERVLKATHGAWEVQCLKDTDTCVMQQVGKTADGKRAMLVLIERLAGVTAEGKSVPAAITVHTPLGVLIPYGVRVKIDQGDVHPVPLMRCLADSCMARAPMQEKDIQMFKKGTSAKFGFFLTDEVLVDVSLNGFTAAFDSLKPVQVPAGAQN